MSAPLVEVRDLAAGYGAEPALAGVSFRVMPGERVAVLGPNGGGKSTLFRVLTGELAPLAGTVELPARVAVVPQSDRSRLDYPVSARDVALMGAVARLPWWRRPGRTEERRARAALDAVGLGERACDRFGALSGGQRQRVLIARALVQDGALLLLDEPFAGVDAPSAEVIEGLIDRLAAEGRGLLVATHDVEQARRFDRVLCLNRRQVAFGAPDVLALPVLEATYGAEIVPLAGTGGWLPPPHHHDHGEAGDGHHHGHEHGPGGHG